MQHPVISQFAVSIVKSRSEIRRLTFQIGRSPNNFYYGYSYRYIARHDERIGFNGPNNMMCAAHSETLDVHSVVLERHPSRFRN